MGKRTLKPLEQSGQTVSSRPLHRPRRQREEGNDSTSKKTGSPTIPLGSPSTSPDHYDQQFLLGLTIAGAASVLLTTVFSLFHVDVFLRVYDLPLSVFATGNFIFSFINTANDLAGAWFVDHVATKASRSSLVGLSGCIFAVCFLAPYFRPQHLSGWKAGMHFVTSLSLYDTMYSFMAILMGSVITDNHNMSDRDRVRFMASGKLVNLVASFCVARVGLELFESSNMQIFRVFLLGLSMLTCCMFVAAQILMNGPHFVVYWNQCCGGRRKADEAAAQQQQHGETHQRPSRKAPLKLRQVVWDFWTHSNFRAWIGMEMLLECQNTFVHSFMKTFVDRLILDAGVSRDSCDWILSILPSLSQVAGIICYIPIRHFGYHKVYTWLFASNLVLSVSCLLLVSPSSHPTVIVGFLVIYKVTTGAVQSAGFHLAMSDMVLEMKRKHADEERFDESYAGLFMGANALLCKPMESFLPIVAAYFLGDTDFSSENFSDQSRQVLFHLLVVPPAAFSCLQLLSWSRYTLHPERTEKMRGELQRLHSAREEESTYIM
jgi:Na+/melibiose symporter-like transporter